MDNMVVSKINSAVSVLVGLAAGDRIGGPIRMVLCLAESLKNHQGFELKDIVSWYFAWWKEDGFDTGPISARVFELVKTGV